MFDSLHINNEGVPLCGAAAFDRDLLCTEQGFTNNPDNERPCWECGSIIGIDVLGGNDMTLDCIEGAIEASGFADGVRS